MTDGEIHSVGHQLSDTNERLNYEATRKIVAQVYIAVQLYFILGAFLSQSRMVVCGSGKCVCVFCRTAGNPSPGNHVATLPGASCQL